MKYDNQNNLFLEGVHAKKLVIGKKCFVLICLLFYFSDFFCNSVRTLYLDYLFLFNCMCYVVMYRTCRQTASIVFMYVHRLTKKLIQFF